VARAAENHGWSVGIDGDGVISAARVDADVLDLIGSKGHLISVDVHDDRATDLTDEDDLCGIGASGGNPPLIDDDSLRRGDVDDAASGNKPSECDAIYSHKDSFEWLTNLDS